MSRRITVNSTAFHVDESISQPFWSLVNEGRWEPETFDLIDRLLGPNWRFVDIGAWIGPTTLYAAAKCCSVDAFECDPVAINHLRDNLALNPGTAARVQLNAYALSVSESFIHLFSRVLGNSETSIFGNHERGGAIVKCEESILVGGRDARNVFREKGYANCARTFIKIDIEGAEFQIVPHLADLIADSQCIWYVSFHEMNLNPPYVPPRHARISEMLRSLVVFAPLHWYNAELRLLNKEEVLDAVLAGVWPAHASFVFSRSKLS